MSIRYIRVSSICPLFHKNGHAPSEKRFFAVISQNIALSKKLLNEKIFYHFSHWMAVTLRSNFLHLVTSLRTALVTQQCYIMVLCHMSVLTLR